MAIKVQTVFWRDIPAQVKARAGRQRFSRPLSNRFPVAIDEAAMRAGKTASDDYLAEWRNGEWEERDGELEGVVADLIAELESVYTPARLRSLVRQGGLEEVAQ